MGKQKRIKADDGEIYGTSILHKFMSVADFAEAKNNVLRSLRQGFIHPKLINPPHCPENPME